MNTSLRGPGRRGFFDHVDFSITWIFRSRGFLDHVDFSITWAHWAWPSDLEPALDAAGMCGTVLVESRSHVSETERLLGIAAAASCVRGVVGRLPLVAPGVEALLERHSMEPKPCP